MDSDAAEHQRFLAEAIAVAVAGVTDGQCGPFGAVVVKDGTIIARGHNQVVATNDPTAHAELVAIRAACRVLGTFQLEGCAVYASCEPCPMCFGALYWARPRAVYWAATRDDAAAAGFDDAFVYAELALPPEARRLEMRRVAVADAGRPFAAWLALASRVPY